MKLNADHQLTHLQVHSHFSLLGGTASVEDLAARAAAEGMSHLALTDSNALYGAIAFERACQGAGIQPILGMTVSVRPPHARIATTGATGRLVLLATGPAGYRSLCRLSSALQAHPERASRVARGLGWEDLQNHRAGLICLSGGRMGWMERLFREGHHKAASHYGGRLVDIYGDGAYLSIEIDHADDWAVVQPLAGLAREEGLQPVAVQPVFCLAPEEVPRLRLLAAINHNLALQAVPRAALPARGREEATLHWLAPGELAARFAGFPDSLAGIGEIIDRCGPARPKTGPIWPNLKLPKGQTPDEALQLLARAGLKAIYPLPWRGAAEDRLRSELSAIQERGYAPLFLVVADIVRFARKAGIPVNTRGSVANSLAAYCCGITNVDPMAHDLLFERFLNPARADLPDIDLDFCSRRRDDVLDYLRRTYGPNQVALVSTVSTLRLRGAVRETAKAYGLDRAKTDRLVSRLPRHWHPDPRRRDRRTVQDVLAELQDPTLQEVIQAACSLVGQPHHLSVHPGGVIITPGPLTDLLPVQWAPKGFLITQFGHSDVGAVGLPKIDLLGIRALTVLAEAERLVQRHSDPAFRLEEIPEDDPGAADLLARGETIGVFQCESVGAQRTLRQLQARSTRDLAVANAFFKPGPATGGMAQTFVRRYRGEQPVTFLHPSLAPILASTKGVLLFQEQVLRVAREIAGLTWEQADQLRRGMSHFGHHEMAEMRQQFVAGCQRPPPGGPGMSSPQAETLWDQVLAFAGYGFNQGHATSYAVVSYRSAFLKTHWPASFLCARLGNWGGYHHPSIYMAEAVRLGLRVRPPHVNESGRRFALGWVGDQAVLWMGLARVRDLRRASIRALLEERQQQAFAGVRDLARRVPMQRKELAHLIQCGALDGLGESRAALLAEADEMERAGSTLQMAFAFSRPQVPAESPVQRLNWEQQLLGQPVSVHPLELVADRLAEHLPLQHLPDRSGHRVAVAGVRLPGWTGGQGFFLGDARTFVVTRYERTGPAPRPWQPLIVEGRWLGDEWGGWWLQVDKWEEIPLPDSTP